MTLLIAPNDILDFWFAPQHKELWFVKNADFDGKIRAQFELVYQAAIASELDHWQDTPEGVLALVIVLDQFPRNLYRNSAKAYQTDAKALGVAQKALENKFDQKLTPEQRLFLYMPFMHSEELEHQETSVQLFKSMGDENAYQYAVLHRDIVARFNRFPHRNEVLGRLSTPEEVAFLKQPNSSF